MIGAAAPLPVILRTLAREGWGPFGGRQNHAVSAILRALGDMLDPRTGAGLVTAPQVADRAGQYSERWTRDRLQLLESLGILTWTRGGIVDGRPAPSFVRLSKSALVALLGPARKGRAAREADRAAVTAARLAPLPQNLRSKGRKRRSVHAEVTASPLPSGGYSPGPAAAGGPETDPRTATRRTAAHMPAVRAALREALALARQA